MSNLFQKAFIHVLREAPEMPADASPEKMTDNDAMMQTLDKGSDPSMYDTDKQASDNHYKAANEMHNNMKITLNHWIEKLEEFSTFLNAPNDPNSMQSKLKHGMPDSLFDKIRVAETKKIARVAMEVTSLNEMLKGYSASSEDPKFRGI